MAFGDQNKTYPKKDEVSLELMARGTEAFLIQREGMTCQILQTPTGFSVQAKKKDDWKKFALLDNALTVELQDAGQFVNVHVGTSKWVSKGAAMGVGMIVAWPIGVPLMALSAIGGFGSVNMAKRIIEFIDQFMYSNGTCIHVPEPGDAQYGRPNPYGAPAYGQPAAYGGAVQTQNRPQSKKCATCGAAVAMDMKFCPECGAPAVPKVLSCPDCGRESPDGTKFCPECGGKLTEI